MAYLVHWLCHMVLLILIQERELCPPNAQESNNAPALYLIYFNHKPHGNEYIKLDRSHELPVLKEPSIRVLLRNLDGTRNRNINKNRNYNTGVTHIMNKPMATIHQYSYGISPIVHQIQPQILAELNYNFISLLEKFIMQIEFNQLRIFNISLYLLELFKNNPYLKYHLLFIYSSPKLNLPASEKKLDDIQNFISYLIKLLQSSAIIPDLTLEIISIIMRQPNPLELLPPLPPGMSPDYILSMFENKLNHQMLADNNIQEELKNLIDNLIINCRIPNIPPSLLDFITREPNLQNLIEDIFVQGHYPKSQIDPQIITKLLELIKDINMGIPIDNIPDSLIDVILLLKGTDNLEKLILDILSRHKPSDLSSALLQILEKYGELGVPPHIENWISTLPKGQTIINFLQRPGKIHCSHVFKWKVKCTKTMEHLVNPQIDNANAAGILKELEMFILNIIYHNTMQDISPELIEFIVDHPDLHEFITSIFTKDHITSPNTNSQLISQILDLIRKNKSKEPIHDLSESTLNSILNLQGNDLLVSPILKWVIENKPNDIMQIFLRIMKQNEGKEIPENLRQWLLTLSNGQQIIEYLQIPGKIECQETHDRHVHCIKTVGNNSNFGDNINTNKNTNVNKNILTN